jgi:hypothetical protein
LAKSPGFAIAAVLTLAIGIGANTAVFSIMDAVVFRPLAVPDLNHVVTVYELQNRGDYRQVALGNFADWQRQSSSIEEMAIRSPADMSLTGAGDAAHVQAEFTSPAFFSVMRANAFLGRIFSQNEMQPGRDNVAVLSYGFWKSHFASDVGVGPEDRTGPARIHRDRRDAEDHAIPIDSRPLSPLCTGRRPAGQSQRA